MISINSSLPYARLKRQHNLVARSFYVTCSQEKYAGLHKSVQIASFI